MNYFIHKRLFMLAAEYVLGTMRGKARIRFLKLLLCYPPIRPYVWHWEVWLIELSANMSSPTPSIDLKQKVFSRLNLESGNL